MHIFKGLAPHIRSCFVILGYTNPSVSATNHLFNIVAIPSGVYRYYEFVDSLEVYFQELGRKEVDSSEIGERVIGKLREWDEVAYVRFASVYRQFRDIQEFMDELQDILRSRGEDGETDRHRVEAIGDGDEG
ncbi:MAG: ATP cone domain-containing protein [Desulfatiglandaceae bacterium]